MSKQHVLFAKIIIVPLILIGCGHLGEMIIRSQYWPLFVLVLLSIFFVDIATLARGKLQLLLIGIYSLMLSLAAVEALALIFNPSPEAVETHTPDFFGFQPDLGVSPAHEGIFRARKTDARTGDVIYDVYYIIDNSLLRRTQSSPDGAAVAFFGDSWTFGHGVNDADALPQVFADLNQRRFPVLNLGFEGYGPEHFLRAMETSVHDLLLGPHPQLFVFTTFPFQAERTSCKPVYSLRSPHYSRDQSGTPRFQGPCSEGWRHWALAMWMNTATYRRYFEAAEHAVNKNDMELYIATTLRAVRVAEEKHHVPTLIIYDRVPEEYLKASGMTNDDIMSRFRNAGVEVLDMNISNVAAPGAMLTIPHDGHPTAIAQHARAVVLQRYIDEHGLIRNVDQVSAH